MDVETFIGLAGIEDRKIRASLEKYQERLEREKMRVIYAEMQAHTEKKFRRHLEAELRNKLKAELRPIIAQEAEEKLRETITREVRQSLGKLEQEIYSQDVILS